jgi:transcriptional regulator with XRE-family HTH domain
MYTNPIADHKQPLARTLRRLRTERNLSQSDLGRATGISSSFLSLVEQGRSDITIGRLLRLAEFYAVELTDLLGDDVGDASERIQRLRMDPSRVLHSPAEGVDVYELTAGSHWTLVPVMCVHQPGGAVDVDELREREAILFVLEGIFVITFDDCAPIRVRRGEGAMLRSPAPYRVENVGKRLGRVLAIGLRSTSS